LLTTRNDREIQFFSQRPLKQTAVPAQARPGQQDWPRSPQVAQVLKDHTVRGAEQYQ
jgi:hypothetical protein